MGQISLAAAIVQGKNFGLRERIMAISTLKAVAEVCAQTGWRVHAWVMMGNHYHLFVETPEANLIEGMKWLQNTYTRRFEALQREAPSVGKGVRGPLQVRGGGGRIARLLWELGGLHPP